MGTNGTIKCRPNFNFEKDIDFSVQQGNNESYEEIAKRLIKQFKEEMEELTFLRHTFCKLKISSALEDKSGKVNVLIQAYLSRARVEVSSLISDTLYIAQVI